MQFTAAPRPVVRSVIWDRGGVPRQLLPCPRMASAALPASSWSMCRCLWCDLVALRGTQAQPRAEPPVLFELREHHRPPSERDPAECHREPSVFAARGPQAGGAADEGRVGGGCRCREHTSAVGRRIVQSFLDPCIALLDADLERRSWWLYPGFGPRKGPSPSLLHRDVLITLHTLPQAVNRLFERRAPDIAALGRARWLPQHSPCRRCGSASGTARRVPSVRL